jgi:hypothetical protein
MARGLANGFCKNRGILQKHSHDHTQPFPGYFFRQSSDHPSGITGMGAATEWIHKNY